MLKNPNLIPSENFSSVQTIKSYRYTFWQNFSSLCSIATEYQHRYNLSHAKNPSQILRHFTDGILPFIKKKQETFPSIFLGARIVGIFTSNDRNNTPIKIPKLRAPKFRVNPILSTDYILTTGVSVNIASHTTD